MDLSGLETLSLAAEATAALLLIAFAWRPRKSEVATVHQQAEPTHASEEHEKSFFLQNCLYRGLYLQLQGQTGSELYLPANSNQDDSLPSVPSSWHDRLTKLLNRVGFDTIVEAWLAIDPKIRGSSAIAMVSIANHEELLSTHGAMALEQLKRRMAEHLNTSLSDAGLVARYLPDRFAILHFNKNAEACQTTLQPIQQSISADSFFEIAGKAVNVQCTISIHDLQQAQPLAELIDALDEGLAEAASHPQSIVLRKAQEQIDAPSPPTAIEPAEQTSTNPEQAVSESTTAEVDAAPANSNLEEHSKKPIAKSNQDEAGVDALPESTEEKQPARETASREETSASSDVSAVASLDDIEALFEQIKGKKQSQPKTSEAAPPQATAS